MKNHFFHDHNGDLSSMRLYCFISLMMACFITIYDILMETNHYIFTVTYLICTFAPKSVQKLTELSAFFKIQNKRQEEKE